MVQSIVTIFTVYCYCCCYRILFFSFGSWCGYAMGCNTKIFREPLFNSYTIRNTQADSVSFPGNSCFSVKWINFRRDFRLLLLTIRPPITALKCRSLYKSPCLPLFIAFSIDSSMPETLYAYGECMFAENY